MKHIIFILLLYIFSTEAFAQEKGKINLKNARIEKVGNKVQVSFTAEIGKKAVKKDYKLTLTPILYKGQDSIRLKPIVVYTRNARIVAIREQISAGKHTVEKVHEYQATNGTTVDYSYSLPYKEWMNYSNVTLIKTVAGCCTEDNYPASLLAENVELVPPEKVETAVAQPQPTQFKWTFSKEDMMVDFIVSKADINFDLFENQEVLAEIVEAVKKIQTTRGAALDKIEITGYASPEGRRDFNRQLAENRAIALRNYLKDQIQGLRDEDFNLINGEENWKGLRDMVAASDMKDKDAVLYIIDNVPVEVDLVRNTSRKKQLMDLKKGEPYRYMLKNFYPRLRNACYIGVYYMNMEKIY